MDDILIVADTAEQARDHTLGFIYRLGNLGFIIHPEKSLTTPTQEIRVPGGEGQLSIHGTEGAGVEAKEDSAESCQAYEDDSTSSTQGVMSSGKAEFSLSGAPGPMFCRMLQTDMSTALETSN